MSKQEILKKILIISSILKRKGINIKRSISLILNNPELLNVDYKELEKRLFIIVNHNQVYAALYVKENIYSWSVLKNNIFSRFVTSEAKENNNDYIIEMMIESIDKYSKIINDQNVTLEQKIGQYQLIKKNEDGYHLK